MLPIENEIAFQRGGEIVQPAKNVQHRQRHNNPANDGANEGRIDDAKHEAVKQKYDGDGLQYAEQPALSYIRIGETHTDTRA